MADVVTVSCIRPTMSHQNLLVESFWFCEPVCSTSNGVRVCAFLILIFQHRQSASDSVVRIERDVLRCWSRFEQERMG
ncbi:hypothetical protein D918_02180 [Trichuris suis]|nr:hypothetical protein D918_02180 [Trichuris suis]